MRPRVTLGLLSVQHALIHGQSALYPLVYLAIIDEFGVSAASIVILSTIGSVSSGLLQYTFAAITRWVSRKTVLGVGGLIVGVGTALQAAAQAFPPFAVANIVSRIGGSPQHPVGNALLAEQFPPNRLGSAIAVHVAGGNVGTVVVGFAAALTIGVIGWRGAVLGLGIAAFVVAIAILVAVRESVSDADRVAAETPVRQLYRRVLQERNLRWVYLAAVLGGGSRGLGVLNIFVPLYLDQVLGLDTATIGLMYGILLAASVPGPLVAGWLSDRIGRKPVIIGVYVGGACSIAFFVLAGSDIAWVWAGIILLSLFSFVESPQLQALLADVAPGPMRDAAYQHLLRAGIRGRVDVGDHLRARHRHWRAERRQRGWPDHRVLAHGRGVDPGRDRDIPDPDPAPRRAAAGPRDGHGGRPRLTCRQGDRRRGMRYHAPAPERAPTVGAWRSLVARIVRDDEVGGSNPLAPTRLTFLHADDAASGQTPVHRGRWANGGAHGPTRADPRSATGKIRESRPRAYSCAARSGGICLAP